MGDPELRSDEKVLVRTPGVYVKSIPFEGILTNKRIILIDRAKNLLPPKEIPLVTIKEIESGENAIRDQIITLTVMAKTGETRQMILTFSRQAGGNRIKERDAWARIIKENTSSSFDHVIRKVIPGPEPAPRRADPVPHQKYEVVHSPLPSSNPSAEHHPAGSGLDTNSPARRSGTTPSDTPVRYPPLVRQPDATSAGTSLFCSKCGNMVPAESVFCNRCGSPIARILPVPAPVQNPASLPVIKTPGVRPIDEEIQSIEPLIEPAVEKAPADALRAVPEKVPEQPPLTWDENETPEPASVPEAGHSELIPVEQNPAPQPLPAQPMNTAIPSPVPSSGGLTDSSPPPKPPRDRSVLPGKGPILTAAVAVVAILLVAAGAIFIYPMLTSDGSTSPSGPADVTPTSTSSTTPSPGTIVIRETQAPLIPATGVYVHINYLGGFKGIYGMPDMITTVPGNSGDRVWEVENATNSTVQATFEKLDGSSHELLVEIYKNGKVLTSGTTTVGHGSVALSVDIPTEIAAAPVTSGTSSTAKNPTAAAVTTVAAVMTAAPAENATTLLTPSSTTVASDTTTAAT